MPDLKYKGRYPAFLCIQKPDFRDFLKDSDRKSD